MNKYDLFDAFGGIDDDLLQRSEEPKTARRIPFRKALIAAAAVMALAVTAIAAPIIREFLFPAEPVLVSEGKRHIYGDLYRDIEKDEYRIDLSVSSSDPLPTEIDEVRLPHYMIENDWLVAYGEVDAVYSEGPVHFKWWDRESPKWVTFEQKCIQEGTASFHLETYHGAEMIRNSQIIDDVEMVYYTIPSYHNQETWEFYPRETAVYWSDGEYAYHLQCSIDITPEELAQIVRSVQTVEDVTPYLKNDPNNDGQMVEMPPLEVHRMPTAIANDYELKVCADDDWVVTWIWENDEGCVIQFIESHSNIYTDLFMAETYKNYPDYSHEELHLNGNTIHYFRFSDRHWFIWEDGSYCDAVNVPIPFGHVYHLWWEGSETITQDDLLTILESVTEVSDISDYVTS